MTPEEQKVRDFWDRFTVPGIWRWQAESLWLSALVLLKERSIRQERSIQRLRVAASKQGAPATKVEMKPVKTEPDDFPDPLENNRTVELLQGYAIELLLKAIWYARNPKEDAPPGVWKSTRGHNLNWLSKDQLGLAWSDDEQNQLQDLTEATTWFGRYPAPFILKQNIWSFKSGMIFDIYRSLMEEYRRCLEANRSAIQLRPAVAAEVKLNSPPAKQ